MVPFSTVAAQSGLFISRPSQENIPSLLKRDSATSIKIIGCTLRDQSLRNHDGRLGMEIESESIDMQALERLRRLGGNELVSRMSGLFLSHAAPAIREASEGLARGDLDKVGRAAHSLRSSAGNLGAQHVQDLANRIEQLCVEEDAEGIKALLIDLERAYLDAKDRLAKEMH